MYRVADRRELWARLLVAVIAVLAMLLVLFVSMLVGAVRSSSAVATDGRKVDATVTASYPGRTGEITVEYYIESRWHQTSLRCGVTCPEKGQHIEVVVSKDDPRQAVLPESPYADSTKGYVALYGIVAAGIGILLSIGGLRHIRSGLRSRLTSSSPQADASKRSELVTSKDPHFHPLMLSGLPAFALLAFGIATAAEAGMIGEIALVFSLVPGTLFLLILVRGFRKRHRRRG